MSAAWGGGRDAEADRGTGVPTKGGSGRTAKGRVAIVGAGPGDPELLTLRGRRLLGEADVVLYDTLVSPRLLAFARPSARKIDVGKPPGGGGESQPAIHALLLREARDGNFVVRLKGGDPFVFGRGGEEALFLAAHGIPFEIVPGVTSAVAVPAAAGIPVTHRGVSNHFTVVTGAGAPPDGPPEETWEALARTGGTLVFLMAAGNLERVAARLAAGGLPPETPAAMIRSGTNPDEVIVEGTLGDIAGRVRASGLLSPATLVVGEVVRLRSRVSGAAARGEAPRAAAAEDALPAPRGDRASGPERERGVPEVLSPKGARHGDPD